MRHAIDISRGFGLKHPSTEQIRLPLLGSGFPGAGNAPGTNLLLLANQEAQASVLRLDELLHINEICRHPVKHLETKSI